MSITIREAEPKDFSRVAELTVAAYLQGGHLTAEDSYLTELQDVPTRARDARLLVAEYRGEVAASAALTDSSGPFAEVSGPGEMEFRMLSVDPRHQGHGLARGMVRHIIGCAQARPEIHALTLCSMVTMTAAHRLYRSEGFVEVPDRDFLLDIEEKTVRFPFFMRKV